MNKGRLYVQNAARIKLAHPTTQLLIKLLLSIILISLVLIAIYDNHSFVQTKVTEYRSKIPSLEYPKLNEDDDYETVHEHVYDNNARIDENYIDIDYKADDNIYDEYSDESERETKGKLVPVNDEYKSDSVLQGTGFKNENVLQKQDYNEDTEGDEELVRKPEDHHRSEINAPNVHDKFDNIYDETDGSNEEKERTGLRETVTLVEEVKSIKAWKINGKNDIDNFKQKTDRVEYGSEIEKQISNEVKDGNASVTNSKDWMRENNRVINNRSSNVTHMSQIERPEHGVDNFKSSGVNRNIFYGNYFKENAIANDTKETHKATEKIHKETEHGKIAYDFENENEEEKYGTSEKENNGEINSSGRLTNMKPLIQANNTVQILQHTQPSRETSPETTTKIAYDIFKYSVRTSSNSTSSLQLGVANKSSRTRSSSNVPKGNKTPQGSLHYPRAKRRLPQALVIGVRKCGTRALLEMLYLHPRVQRAVGEVHFFDRDENYARGLEWYRQQMPLSYANQVTIEKSPSYFVTPEAPERIRAMNSSVRLLIIVRDPVTRAISDYTQLKIHAAATSSGPVKRFEQLALKDDGEINEHYRPIAISVYHNFMYAWLEMFPKEQLLIVNGDRLIEDPVPELQRIERFLNLEPAINHENFYYNHTKGFYCLKDGNMERCLRESKGRKHVRVPPKVIAKMREYFNYHNQLFYELLDENFDWPEE